MKMRHMAIAAGAVALVAGFGAAPAALAQEVTIRAVSGFPKASFFSRRFEAMIE